MRLQSIAVLLFLALAGCSRPLPESDPEPTGADLAKLKSTIIDIRDGVDLHVAPGAGDPAPSDLAEAIKWLESSLEEIEENAKPFPRTHSGHVAAMHARVYLETQKGSLDFTLKEPPFSSSYAKLQMTTASESIRKSMSQALEILE